MEGEREGRIRAIEKRAPSRDMKERERKWIKREVCVSEEMKVREDYNRQFSSLIIQYIILLYLIYSQMHSRNGEKRR